MFLWRVYGDVRIDCMVRKVDLMIEDILDNEKSKLHSQAGIQITFPWIQTQVEKFFSG